jgi:pimeloyl-ACP methyl ester carboxylesterase
VARLDVPVSVVYGDRDSIVPPEQSRAVAEAAPVLSNVTVVAGADHNDAGLVHGGPVIDAVVDLADQIEEPDR